MTHPNFASHLLFLHGPRTSFIGDLNRSIGMTKKVWHASDVGDGGSHSSTKRAIAKSQWGAFCCFICVEKYPVLGMASNGEKLGSQDTARNVKSL